ncbi:GntR family transcriptional regulator [Methylomicrobium sp. RS1]|jgi:DNA-binding GntR family transcriptional regulator|uniref:GntR family transcriptional regulator n=1 Tax=Candidatus Methylomicrobium oryzae TaxID=2802053 RepID=UPI001920B06D|nr:GntR family transcriptional regulator [Methylomicrobium sp. RS1]MBL1263427.1 GntR family transcriptional regulator [Methylomicrobium sp. RS1]
MTTVKSETAQSIYIKLRSMILNFEIQPNTRLTETELATYFKVSRTPIREALQRLETEELISIRPKQGCFVRGMDFDELNDYYQIRIHLEMLSLETACRQMPNEALEQLCAVWKNAPATGSPDDAERIANLDEAFHIRLAEGGGNRMLVKMLGGINNRIRIVRRLDFTDRDRICKTFEEHYKILESLLRRDVEAAKSAMTEHIKKSEEFTKRLTMINLGMHKNRGFLFKKDAKSA